MGKNRFFPSRPGENPAIVSSFGAGLFFLLPLASYFEELFHTKFLVSIVFVFFFVPSPLPSDGTGDYHPHKQTQPVDFFCYI